MAFSLSETTNWLNLYLPNAILQAAVIAILSIILAKLGDLIIFNVVVRLVKKTKSELDDKIARLLHRPLFLTLLIAGLSLALYRLAPPENLYFAVSATFKTILVFVWTIFSIKTLSLLLSALCVNSKPGHFLQTRSLPLFKNLTYILVGGGAAYFIFISWKIDVTAWLASAGIIGIALGFAAKDTLANLFSGIFILADAPYKIGDIIVLDSGERGEVTHIGIRSTRILTRDDVEVTIPNAIMGNTKINNESGGPHLKARVRVKIGVAYGSDIHLVRETLMKVATSNSDICPQPEPRVRFRQFGDSSLDFELLVWVTEPILRGRVLDRLNCDVYLAFNKHHIDIPFPQSDLHIKEFPATKIQDSL